MGGGYTQSPGGFGSPAASQGGDRKGRARAQNIIPCTVSQIKAAVQSEDVFRVGDVEISQVTIVGVIRSVDKSMTNIQYIVDDMTAAPMDVKQWVDAEEPGMDGTVIPPGTYVKVSGNLRSFQNNRSLVAFRIRPLEDMNEIISHMLEVVNAHMQLSKPQATTGSGVSVVTPVSVSNMGSGGGMTTMSGGGGGGGGMYGGSNSVISNGLNPNQNQVLCLIKSCPEPQGISIQELKQRLSGMNINVIRQVVDFLSNEGHIFSTIDEDHFRSTDNDM